MRLFGTSEIFKNDKRSKAKSFKDKMKSGDDYYKEIEEKFLKGEAITQEEFNKAEEALQEADKEINLQINSDTNEGFQAVDGAPAQVIQIMMRSLIQKIITMVATIAYKRALLKLIRKKYDYIKGNIPLDAGEQEETE